MECPGCREQIHTDDNICKHCNKVLWEAPAEVSPLDNMVSTARVEIGRDIVAGKLDEMADLCEYWKCNRKAGRDPKAIRAALLQLAEEVTLFKPKEYKQIRVPEW